MGLEARKFSRGNSHPSAMERITNIEDARERIHELFERGERPVISIPEEYTDALVHGLRAHTTWIPGFDAIAGTFAREPYLPKKENRVLVEVDIPEEQIEPRFTGPEKKFSGVVILHGPIPANRLRRLN